MAQPIPIQNLYYLLSYAWDQRVTNSEMEAITGETCPDLNQFFAEVLDRGLHHLLRRGLDRAYLSHEELTSRPRGRIDFTASAKRQTWHQSRMHCVHDDLSHDVLQNQILKSTLELLARDRTLPKEKRNRLQAHLPAFAQVQSIRVTQRSFRRIQLHRNNQAYRFLLHLCDLVHASLLPEQDHNGKRRFKSLEANDRLMNKLFEKFILHFAQRHLSPAAQFSAPKVKWLAEFATQETALLMPEMKTDIAISWPDRKLIIDCKYYSEALKKNQYGGAKFDSSNLYQLVSYLTNQREVPGWRNGEGMLLYPTTSEDFFHNLKILGHNVQVRSINLDQGWQLIEEDLLRALLATSGGFI